MQSIAEGKSNKEIGSLLGVATKTVDNHRSRLMQKLGVHNAASLTLVAVRRGVVPAGSVPAGPLEGLSLARLFPGEISSNTSSRFLNMVA
jgi:hypothetical protein